MNWTRTGAMSVLALVIGVAFLSVPSAYATPGDEKPAQSPLLRLSVNATVKVTPDELVADLVAMGISDQPAAAQRRVNTLIAQATEIARKAGGIDVSIQGYFVTHDDRKPPQWTARQTAELRGKDSERLLAIVGDLQSAGLTIEALDWRLADDTWQQAHDAASVLALKRLRSQADIAAKTLGMTVDRFQEVRLDQQQPMMSMARVAKSMAAAMPAPLATPDQLEVTASASADVLLKITQ